MRRNGIGSNSYASSNLGAVYSRFNLREMARVFAQPHWIFLVIAFLGGVALIFVTGPFQAPDEFAHFYRAYEISEGKMFAVRNGNLVGAELPLDLLDAGAPFYDVVFHRGKVDRLSLDRLLNKPLDHEKTHFVLFPNTALYIPFLYLPHAVGIALGRACGASALALLYWGRMAGLLAWMACIWAAIRILPIFKWTVMLLALLPMHLFLAAAVTADTVVNASAVLFAALVARTALGGQERVDNKVLLAVAASCIALATAKSFYAPLCALLLVIPSRRLGGVKSKAAYCVTVLVASVTAAALWGNEASKIYVPLGEADPTRQLAGILEDPLRFTSLLLTTAWRDWTIILKAFVSKLGWADTSIPRWTARASFPVLILTAFFDKSGRCVFDIRQKIWMGLVSAFTYFLILTALYLSSTSPGALSIEGIQDRYFIPLVLPVLFLFSNRSRQSPDRLWIAGLLISYAAIVVITTCITVYSRYYG